MSVSKLSPLKKPEVTMLDMEAERRTAGRTGYTTVNNSEVAS